ncbi:MAG: amidohydrolase family protein [Bdellovibrio sp.]|nr:amidohydrolase family protein [Bdellovibrio sp.]
MESLGAVDIHFHGAFGVDLMSASLTDLDQLSAELWKHGVAGFCPTTLSAPEPTLLETVAQLGKWIRRERHPGAQPLGIHLEGPFIAPHACGAHPKKTVRRFNWKEFLSLWRASQKTLKIVTLAPEQISRLDLLRLIEFAKENEIRLSVGHTSAGQVQAAAFFQKGICSVTHAWNAMAFHHRDPGVLGAALGNPKIWIELIPDQVHVSGRVLDWTTQIHPQNRVCFVSDCIPPGGVRSRGKGVFGPLEVRIQDGACRLPSGALAGGSKLLPLSFSEWLYGYCYRHNTPVEAVFRRALAYITTNPLEMLQLRPGILSHRRVLWQI